MNNTLTIKAVEIKTFGTNEIAFGIIASDHHGTFVDFGYPSKEKLFETWPNRITAARKVFAETAFEGTGYVDNDDCIILDSFTAIEFEGFPDSGALIVRQYAEMQAGLFDQTAPQEQLAV